MAACPADGLPQAGSLSHGRPPTVIPISPSPDVAGLDQAAIKAAFTRAQYEFQSGAVDSCQIAVARGGLLKSSPLF